MINNNILAFYSVIKALGNWALDIVIRALDSVIKALDCIIYPLDSVIC